jgi:flagella basal body P-ring formation protein FlgA
LKSETISYIKNIAAKESLEVEILIPKVYDLVLDDIDSPKISVSAKTSGTLTRNFPVIFEIRNNDNKTVKQTRVLAKLKIFAKAAVLSNPVERGKKIKAEDIVIKRVDITGLENFFKSPQDANGIEAKAFIRAGTVLSNINIRPVFVVKRGNKVKVEVKEGDVYIKTEGTARENGYIGDSIKIYIDITKTTIKCKVVDATTVIAGT